MKYYVNIGDREFEIDLVDRGDGLEGRFNGKRCRVDYAEIEEGLKYSVIVDGESFNVSVHRTPEGEDLIFGGHLFRARVLDERERGALALEKARSLKGPQVVKSVMPGVVVELLVAEGAAVRWKPSYETMPWFQESYLAANPKFPKPAHEIQPAAAPRRTASSSSTTSRRCSNPWSSRWAESTASSPRRAPRLHWPSSRARTSP